MKTKTKTATLQLEQRLGLLQAVVDSASEHLIAVDQENRVVLINARAARFLQVKAQEVIGQSAELLNERYKALIGDLDRFTRMEDEIRQDICRAVDQVIQFKTDPPVYFHRHSVPILGPQGEYLGRLCVLRDITREKLAEQFQEDFLAIASHELKTPLTSIQGYLETILDKPEMPQKTREKFLRTALQNTQNLSRLVNNVLELVSQKAPAQRVESARCSFREVYKMALDSIHAKLTEKKIRVEASIAANLPLLQMDQVSLFRILLNLLDNSMKYSGANSTIRVQAKALTTGQVELTVQDEGQGIPAQYQQRVFERFFRVPGTKGSGSGLGLSIVRYLVDTWGGSIQLDSKPGKGCKFRIRLNAAE